MATLPPLNQADEALLTRYLTAGENPHAFLAQPEAPTLLALLAFLARPDITRWLEHYRSLQHHSHRHAALNALNSALSLSPDPVHLRLTASALLNHLRPPRAAAPRPEAHPSHRPRPVAALHDAAIPWDPGTLGQQPGHLPAIQTEPHTAPTPAPIAIPQPGDAWQHELAEPTEPADLLDTSDQADPSDPIAANQPASTPAPLDSLGDDFDDLLQDALIDGDLPDILEPEALRGDLGPDLQRAAIDSQLEEALEEAIDRGDHHADPILAAALARALHTSLGPAG